MPKKNHVDPSTSSGTSPTGPVRFTVAEFADMLGFPVAALNAIISKNRASVKKPFYNISQLADRWGCSRAQVYNVLRETEFKVLNTASKSSEERQSWRIPASVIERIEQSRMEQLPEVAA